MHTLVHTHAHTVLATSGIDYDIKLWEPLADELTTPFVVNVNVTEVFLPSRRLGTIELEDEGVEQLQPTALNSEETTTTGEAVQEHISYGVHATCVAVHTHHTCVS